MNKKSINILLTIISLILSILGIVFLCINIFSDTKNNTFLIIALSSIILSNLINLIRVRINK